MLSWGDFFYRDMCTSPTAHCLCMVTGTHCASRHGARAEQGPEPGFASTTSLAQGNNAGNSFSPEESQMGQAERKEALQQFSCLYTWALFHKCQWSPLDKILFVLFFFVCLATGSLPSATDLSAQDKDRKCRADHSWQVKSKIKIKYVQFQLPTLRQVK